MFFLRQDFLDNFVIIAITIIIMLIIFLKWHYKYWNRIGLETLNPNIPFGDAKLLLTRYVGIGTLYRIFYDQIKAKGLRHAGVYLGIAPVYIPTDPEIMKHIFQKDFEHFQNHGNFMDEVNDPLSGHLFNLEGAKWRRVRAKLTPTFTSGKIKLMFQGLADCTIALKKLLEASAINEKTIDIKDIFARFGTDVIGSTAFGLECNSLMDPEAVFRKVGKRVLENTPFEQIKIMMQFLLPRSVLKFLKFKITKKDVEDFFLNAIKDTIAYRETNNIARNDFLQLLIQLKNGKQFRDKGASELSEIGLSDNEIAAQAYVFFLGGFETSSTTITFALYELAINQQIQDKLRQEINEVLHNHANKLTYEAIMEMTYMELVVNETFRKYPPGSAIFRQCNKDYLIPKTNVILPAGTNVGISILGLQNDPEYYPEPHKFDPERFSEENKNLRPPFTFLPFGEGPRICIGLRFGLMQIKVGLAAALQEYKFRLNPRTESPLQFDKGTIVLNAKGSVWLDIEKI